MTLISMKDELPRRLKIITVSIAAWGGMIQLRASGQTRKRR